MYQYKDLQLRRKVILFDKAGSTPTPVWLVLKYGYVQGRASARHELMNLTSLRTRDGGTAAAPGIAEIEEIGSPASDKRNSPTYLGGIKTTISISVTRPCTPESTRPAMLVL
jgi:hypothetical protein